MRIIVLTTETPHHLYFVKEVSTIFNITGIAVESRGLNAPFQVHHSFEDERDQYENMELLHEEDVMFKDYCETNIFNNINDERCINFVAGLKPDVIITFGTGIIMKPLASLCPNGFINLHGGDPQYYRGLDTHMWAIYHKEFEQLIVTLHRLNLSLDDGEIIQQGNIKLDKNSKITTLRIENTKLCVKLTVSALLTFNQLGCFISKPQQKKGRYYSFMPATLKEVCVNNFEKYIKNL